MTYKIKIIENENKAILSVNGWELLINYEEAAEITEDSRKVALLQKISEL